MPFSQMELMDTFVSTGVSLRGWDTSVPGVLKHTAVSVRESLYGHGIVVVLDAIEGRLSRRSLQRAKSISDLLEKIGKLRWLIKQTVFEIKSLADETEFGFAFWDRILDKVDSAKDNAYMVDTLIEIVEAEFDGWRQVYGFDQEEEPGSPGDLEGPPSEQNSPAGW